MGCALGEVRDVNEYVAGLNLNIIGIEKMVDRLPAKSLTLMTKWIGPKTEP